MGRLRKGRSSRDKGLPKGRGSAPVSAAEQMSGEGSEQRSGPAEAILARRSSRPELPGWLLKEESAHLAVGACAPLRDIDLEAKRQVAKVVERERARRGAAGAGASGQRWRQLSSARAVRVPSRVHTVGSAPSAERLSLEFECVGLARLRGFSTVKTWP